MAAQGAVPAVEIEGMMETLKAVRGISDALERKETNAQLRGAARQCASGLMMDLHRSAIASGVPVAHHVAAGMRVKGDRIPVVQIGEGKLPNGGRAGAVMWGSERGPVTDPNRFAVASNPGGYWIAPTVKRFGEGPAPEIYKRAVVDIYKEHGLL